MKISKNTIKKFLDQAPAAVVVPGTDDGTMIIGGGFWLLQIPRDESLIKWFKQAKTNSREPGRAKWPVDVEMYFDGQPDPDSGRDMARIYRETFKQHITWAERFRTTADEGKVAAWLGRPADGRYIPLFPEVDEEGNPTATFADPVPLQVLRELLRGGLFAAVYSDDPHSAIVASITQRGAAKMVIMPARVNPISDPIRNWITKTVKETR